MQPIFSFKGIYKDAFGEEEIIVFSDGKYLSTTIRGIELDGQGFDNLSLTNPDLVTDRDQIPLYGNNKENLHDCYFNIEMPFLVEIKGEIQDVKSSYETWIRRWFLIILNQVPYFNYSSMMYYTKIKKMIYIML